MTDNTQIIENHETLRIWCEENGLTLLKNNSAYFIRESILMTPEYIINDKIFIDLINDNECFTEKNLEYCKLFSNSFGVLISIPRNLLHKIKNITKYNIEEKYNIIF